MDRTISKPSRLGHTMKNHWKKITAAVVVVVVAVVLVVYFTTKPHCTDCTCPCDDPEQLVKNCGACPDKQVRTKDLCTQFGDIANCSEYSDRENVYKTLLSKQEDDFTRDRDANVKKIQTLSTRIYGGYCETDVTLTEDQCNNWKNADVGYCYEEHTFVPSTKKCQYDFNRQASKFTVNNLNKEDCSSDGYKWKTTSLSEVVANNQNIIDSKSKSKGVDSRNVDEVNNGATTACNACTTTQTKRDTACDTTNTAAQNDKKSVCDKKQDCNTKTTDVYDKGWQTCTCTYGKAPDRRLCAKGKEYCISCQKGSNMDKNNVCQKDNTISGDVCIPDDGTARPLQTKDIHTDEKYVQITGLCGREKYSQPGWQYKYDKRITTPYAQGTIPTYNTDVHPDGKNFCGPLDNNSCKSKQKYDGKYKPHDLCRWDDKTKKCRYKSWGFVQKEPKNAPLFYTPRMEPLDVDFTNVKDIKDMDAVAENFHCLHKVWGAGGSNTSNHGVHKDNIWLDYRGDAYGFQNLKKQYLIMQFQGDLAKSGSLGIKKTDEFTGEGDNCKKYEELDPDHDDNPYARVGAILATKDLYGSGSFEVEAMVPQANKDENEGMGYVFALWTFGYTEMYPISDKNLLPKGQQLLDGNMSTPWFSQSDASKKLSGDELKAKNYQSCGLDNPMNSENCDNSFTCGENGNCAAVKANKKDGNDAPYTAWVSEIDIEIPANPQHNKAGVLWKNQGGYWPSTTVNFNTWRGDDEDYGPNSPYHQHCVKAPTPFISRGLVNGGYEFKKYRFDWYAAGPDGFGRVEFYVNDKLMYTSKRYVPSRITRFVFGPWFGWWGGTSSFDKKEVWVKRVKITPFTTEMGGDKAIAAQNNVVYPQTFNQCNPDATHTQLCDFKALSGNRCEPDVCQTAGMRKKEYPIPDCTTNWKKNKDAYHYGDCNLPNGGTAPCMFASHPISDGVSNDGTCTLPECTKK